MTSWSCPFHAFQLPLHVPDMFSVCPLHFPCMSRSFVASHFPTSPVVPIGFLVLCFPFIPPALPLLSFLFQFPFVSLSFPAAFLSCRLPISFPHFLALPCISFLLPNISRKNTFFPAFSQSGTPSQQRAGRGNRAWDPCFATPAPRLVERHQIAARSVGGGTYQTSGGGVLGRGYPLSSLRCATRREMSADIHTTRS